MTSNANEQYQLIHNICKYKICIGNLLAKFIQQYSQIKIKYGKRLNNLYNCHNILFKSDKIIIWYPTQSMEQSEVKQQEFTIHHFIYYLIVEAVKINKRRSKRFTEYDVYELIEANVFQAYELHLEDLFDKIHSYLHPTHNEKNLSFVLNLKNIFNNGLSLLSSYWLTARALEYIDFGNWTKEDLMYNLINRIENYNDNFKQDDFYIVDCIYKQILNHFNIYKQFTFQDFINFVDFYKQTVSKERLKKYEAELIEKTWHPDRLMDWCFDIEEKNDFATENE